LKVTLGRLAWGRDVPDGRNGLRAVNNAQPLAEAQRYMASTERTH